MSEPAAFEADPDRGSQATASEEPEVLDGVPVLSDAPRLLPTQAGGAAPPAERRTTALVIPAVQAAAVAAGGFVAGAAVVGLAHRRRRRASTLVKGRRVSRAMRRGAGSRRDGRAGELLQIVGSRSLLVDVHLLGGGADR